MMSVTDAIEIGIVQLIIWAAMAGLCARYTSWHMAPLLLILLAGMQLYPLGEILQTTRQGPEWIRHHLSDAGILLVAFPLVNASLLLSMVVRRPVFRKIGHRHRIYNSFNLSLLTLAVAGAALAFMAGYELISMLRHRYAPVENSRYYSGNYDWLDLLAYALGLLPVVLCAWWIKRRTKRLIASRQLNDPDYYTV